MPVTIPPGTIRPLELSSDWPRATREEMIRLINELPDASAVPDPGDLMKPLQVAVQDDGAYKAVQALLSVVDPELIERRAAHDRLTAEANRQANQLKAWQVQELVTGVQPVLQALLAGATAMDLAATDVTTLVRAKAVIEWMLALGRMVQAERARLDSLGGLDEYVDYDPKTLDWPPLTMT